MPTPNTNLINPQILKWPEIFGPGKLSFQAFLIDVFDRLPVESCVLCDIANRHPCAEIHHISLQSMRVVLFPIGYSQILITDPPTVIAVKTSHPHYGKYRFAPYGKCP
jgi:hypothetical protein